ncbi:MAG TPA: ATP-binding protein [Polyangiaceae bacterium]|nr:ATP-binding protein [Polyangiaceae bacterium]
MRGSSRLIGFFVPASFERDTDAYRRAQLCVAFALFLLPLTLVRALTIIGSGLGEQVPLVAAVWFCLVAALLVLKRTASLWAAGNLLVLALFASGSLMAYSRGGVGSPPLIAITALPLVATFVAGRNSGIAWGAAVAAEIATFGVVQGILHRELSDGLSPGHRIRVETIGALSLTLVLLGISLAFEWTKSLALEARAQAERQRLLAEEAGRMLQADRMASVGQLAAGVAHEINNPLGYLTANLDFIEREIQRIRAAEPGIVGSELADAIAESRQGIDRVGLIVRDLKTFTRDDGGTPVAVDVREVCDASIRMVDNEIRHRARLERRYADHPVWVRANETRLVQVLLNLLINAAQATPPGQAERHTITVSVETRGDTVALAVSDTGVGMSPDVLANAVRPFFTTKPVGVGTGLGLAVCDNVVRALGGTLNIESAVGKGCTVSVTLPRAAAPDAVPTVPAPAAREETALRILLIDDDPLIIRAMSRLLRHHAVTAKANGRDALSLLRAGQNFDLILCDLMMPDLSGAEVYEHVVALGQGLERRMVFLTGGAFTEAGREFLERVPNPRFEKPIRADAIDAILSAARAS